MAAKSIRKKRTRSNEPTPRETPKSLEAFQHTLHTILRLRGALKALPWPADCRGCEFSTNAVDELICQVGSIRDDYETEFIESGGSAPPLLASSDLSPPTCALLPIHVGDRIQALRDGRATHGIVVELASHGVFIKVDDDGEVFTAPWSEVSSPSIDCAEIAS